jgi:hypothetical protein
LINDINVVKNRVASSNEWNTMGRLTGDSTKTDWVPSLTYTVNHAGISGTTGSFDSDIKEIDDNWDMSDSIGLEPS